MCYCIPIVCMSLRGPSSSDPLRADLDAGHTRHNSVHPLNLVVDCLRKYRHTPRTCRTRGYPVYHRHMQSVVVQNLFREIDYLAIQTLYIRPVIDHYGRGCRDLLKVDLLLVYLGCGLPSQGVNGVDPCPDFFRLFDGSVGISYPGLKGLPLLVEIGETGEELIQALCDVACRFCLSASAILLNLASSAFRCSSR